MKIDEISKWRQDVFDSTLALRSLISPSVKLPISSVANVPRRLAIISSMAGAVSPASLGSAGPGSAWTMQDREALNASMKIPAFNAGNAQLQSAQPTRRALTTGIVPIISKRHVSVDISADGNENLLQALNGGGDLSAAAFPSLAKQKRTEITLSDNIEVDESQVGTEDSGKMDHASMAISRRRLAL